MTHIKGYLVGDIPAQGAFTSEIIINGLPPLQDIVNQQDVQRKIMDTRPSMYLKYLPNLYDPVNGQLRSSGAYLFNTTQQAAGYWD
jgi:hypothetical protein